METTSFVHQNTPTDSINYQVSQNVHIAPVENSVENQCNSMFQTPNNHCVWNIQNYSFSCHFFQKPDVRKNWWILGNEQHNRLKLPFI